MNKMFNNKTIVITGAGRGLGKALALRFAQAGAYIAACDVNSSTLASLSKDLEALGVQHITSICDVSKEAEVKTFFAAIKANGRSVDVLINNAGITNIKLFQDHTNEDVRRVMDVNFRGAVYAAGEAYDDIIKNKGSFIAISSVAGFAPLVGRSAYAASKHALLGFFETIRTEVAHKGVHVLVVCPGFIDTEIRGHTEHQKVEKGSSPEEIAQLIFKATTKRKPMLITGIGRLSFFMKRFFPNLYERLMIKRMGGELL